MATAGKHAWVVELCAGGDGLAGRVSHNPNCTVCDGLHQGHGQQSRVGTAWVWLGSCVREGTGWKQSLGKDRLPVGAVSSFCVRQVWRNCLLGAWPARRSSLAAFSSAKDERMLTQAGCDTARRALAAWGIV